MYPPTKQDRVITRSTAVSYLVYHTLWHSFTAEFVCASLHLHPSMQFIQRPCNKTQLAAPFILILFGQSTSTCFGHICCLSSGGKKVKWSRYRPGVAQRVGRGIALLFHCTRRGWAVSSTPRPHFTHRKDPVPILQEAGWVPGPVWKGGKSRPHRNSIPDCPARSQSLYRLRYRAHSYRVCVCVCVCVCMCVYI